MTKNTTTVKPIQQAMKALFEQSNKTLKDIHEALGLTQHINNYVRNTNKKYGTSYTETTPINDEEANIIIVNTLGKLRLHRAQATYLRVMSDAGTVVGQHTQVLEKARKYAEKSNLADAVIKMADLVSEMQLTAWRGNIKIIDKLMEDRNVTNRQYFSQDMKVQWFKDNLAYLIKVYKGE